MQRHLLPSFLAALFLSLGSGGATLAQQAPTLAPLVIPPGPVSHFATRFDVVDAPELFDRVLMIIDFPVGAWTPVHTPGGALYVTVIEGEVSTRMAGTPDNVYPAGSTFTANPGEYLQLGNVGSANARLIPTALLPTGGPLTIDQAGVSSDAYFMSDAYPLLTDDYRNYHILDSVSRPPRPTTAYHASIAVERPAGAFELVHLLLDLDPGTWTPPHIHGRQELVLVTAGELTLQRRGAVETFVPGDSWVNASGVVHAAGNDTRHFAQVVASYLLPAGRPLTTVV